MPFYTLEDGTEFYGPSPLSGHEISGLLSQYHDGENFTFDIVDLPTLNDFISIANLQESVDEELFIPTATCLINCEPNFNTDRGKQLIHENMDGKLIDYKSLHDHFDKEGYEYIYFITYNNHIVKIGATSTSIKKRLGSYGTGARRYFDNENGRNSSTNFYISECNYLALIKNYKVILHAYPLGLTTEQRNYFGRLTPVELHAHKAVEELLTKIYIDTYGEKPIFNTQVGSRQN